MMLCLPSELKHLSNLEKKSTEIPFVVVSEDGFSQYNVNFFNLWIKIVKKSIKIFSKKGESPVVIEKKKEKVNWDTWNPNWRLVGPPTKTKTYFMIR